MVSSVRSQDKMVSAHDRSDIGYVVLVQRFRQENSSDELRKVKAPNRGRDEGVKVSVSFGKYQ